MWSENSQEILDLLNLFANLFRNRKNVICWSIQTLQVSILQGCLHVTRLSDKYQRNQIIFLSFLIAMTLLKSGWQKLCEGTKGPRRKVWFRTKILSPKTRYFVGILKFVVIYALFGNLWPWAKKDFWGQKQCCLGNSALIYGMYCILHRIKCANL